MIILCYSIEEYHKKENAEKRKKMTMKNTLNYKWCGKVGYSEPTQINAISVAFCNEIDSI